MVLSLAVYVTGLNLLFNDPEHNLHKGVRTIQECMPEIGM